MNAATLQFLDHADARVLPFVALSAEPASRYGERRRPNWIAIALIAALHALALATLVRFDVIHVGRVAPPQPLVMELIPLAPPPPAAAPEPRAVVRPAPTPIVVPVPEVKTAVVAPPAVTVTVTTAPAPAPVVSAAPAAPAAVAPMAAPITPPSANAATLDNPAPRYPLDARRKKQEGTVRLRVVITVDGRVKEISVARSSGYDSLDDAALAAVRRWRFVPGTQAGQPVEAVGYVPIPFRLT